MVVIYGEELPDWLLLADGAAAALLRQDQVVLGGCDVEDRRQPLFTS
jgi:hypothetical protein